MTSAENRESSHRHAERIVGLYDSHAHDYDRDRSRSLQERAWLDRFLGLLPRGATVLDLGCGPGEPIDAYLSDAGCRIVGFDSSPAMIQLCRERLPGHEWLVGRMPDLDLGRRFNGILAWDSFFHLPAPDQRAMFARFAAHARPGAALMFTSGPAEGEVMGSYRGEPLYHASLDPEEYAALLADHDFDLVEHCPNDPGCGDHTVWLARFRASGG